MTANDTPHRQATERRVLELALQTHKFMPAMKAGLESKHFTNPAYAAAWEYIVQAVERGEDVDKMLCYLDLRKSLGDEAQAIAELDDIGTGSASGLLIPELARELITMARGSEVQELTSRAAMLAAEGKIQEAVETVQGIGGTIAATRDKPDFASLADILDSDLKPEQPTICAFKDGIGALFYAGRLNELHAEPGIGKSNVSLAAVAKVINAGGAVLFIDPEDNPAAFVRKLLCFGADPQKLVELVRYTNDPTPRNLLAVLKDATEDPAQLIIVDGLAECLSANGLSENDAADFLKFVSDFLRPLARTGAAVLICDHVVKSSDGQGRWSRGSGAKLGAYDGVSYVVKAGKAYSPTREGFVKLAVAKDRNGGVGAVGQNIAEIWFSPDGRGQTQVSINQIEAAEDFKPTALMAKVIEYLKDNPDATKRDLRKLGKGEYVDRAIECLEESGALKVENEGAGKRVNFVLIDEEKEVIL